MKTSHKASSAPKTLVTGGAGFIGSHVVDNLIAMGHEVVVLDDLSGGFVENVNSKALFIGGSVTDNALVDAIYQEHRFDYVYHLAAYAAEGLSHFIRRFNYTNNLIGSTTLVNAAVKYGCGCFVFTSSIAVYGASQVPMVEDMKPEPEDPYGIAKYAAELDLAAAHQMFGLNYIIFRPHNVYGERQNIGDRYRNVIGIFMNQIMQGAPCTIFGDGTQTRAFSYISDIAPIIANCVEIKEAYNKIFNIGADVPYSVNELANMVQKTMGVNTGVNYLEARKEVLYAHSDHSKALNLFKYSSRVGLEEGLKNMSKWARIVGPRGSKQFDEIEVKKCLPASWNVLKVVPTK